MRKTDTLWASGLMLAGLGWLFASNARPGEQVGQGVIALGVVLVVTGVAARVLSAASRGSAPRPLQKGDRVAAIEGDGTFAFHKVVGESKYQPALSRAAGGRTEDGVEIEVQAQLVFESDNPYDPNAIAVYVGGAKVGYFARECNVDFRKAVDAMGLDPALPLVCRGLIVGGWSRDGGADRGSFGIRLDIPYED